MQPTDEIKTDNCAIRMYLGDCMDLMKDKPDKFWDLAIVDPEQGKKEHGGKNRSGFVKQKNGSKIFVKDGLYKKANWDNKPASREYFDELFRVSQDQIIWGEQYYHTNFGPGRIIWDKCNGGTDQYDCEIAYCSPSDRTTLFRFMWSGMMQGKSIEEGHIQQGDKSLNEKRIHPTQKPVALYKWLLSNYAKHGQTILDTHGGSFSHAIACYDLGFDLDIIELDPDYYEAGKERVLTHIQKCEEIKKFGYAKTELSKTNPILF